MQRGISLLAKLLALLQAWLWSCVQALPQIHVVTFRQAMLRMGLVLAASLLLIVVISTIDGLLLQMYILGARQLPT